MERKRETESGSELDLSVSKLMSGCGSVRTKSRKSNERKHNEPSIATSLGSVMNSSVSLDPTQALMPTRSSISSLLSMSHLRLWENPMTASAISAAAAMTHLMDINNSAFSAHFRGKSSEDNRVNSNRNMCLICGRVARDVEELENHMLTHSTEKPYKCVKCDKTFKNYRNQRSHQFLFHNITDGLHQNRIQGLLMASKKRKSKHCTQGYDQPLDVTTPDVRRKRIDEYLNSRSHECQSPVAEDNRTKTSADANSAINSMSTNAFPCTSCHKTFATEVDLKAHLMRHLTQHPFVCLACGKGFKYEHSLNFHIKSYHNSGANSSNNNNNNNNNNNTINNNNNNNNTNINNSTTNSISKNVCESETKPLISHKLSDSIEKKSENIEKALNSEKMSEMDFDSETSIEEQTDEDNDDNDENHNKSQCFDLGASSPANIAARSIQIKSEKILITELQGVHPVTEQSYILYKCCLCGYAFPSLDPVILHLQSSHFNTNKEFTCDKCGATFKWRSERTLHERLHKAMDQNDSKGPNLSIPSFLQPNLVLMSQEFGHNLSPNHSINNNNNINLNNNNAINCMSDGMPVCDDKPIHKNYNRAHKKSITQTKSLKIKTETQHSSDVRVDGIQNAGQLSNKFPTAIGDIEETSPGQFKCRFCDKTFDRIFSVHRHERVHTGFKPCICKTCGRGFSEKRNLRHHIIRFHSDGSGRELLKRNRKDKNNGLASNKRKVATSLKKTALKILNGTDGNDINDNEIKDTEDNDREEEELEPKSEELNESNDRQNERISSNTNETSIKCSESTNITQTNSSKRRRKGKPSKKIITTEQYSPDSSSQSNDMNMNGETQDNDELQNTETNREESVTNSGSDINPQDFLETKLRSHGAFFSSYNPRLGVVEKPVKRNEACRPLLGPDGKFLYPCTYCNKTFCSLSDLNRHMNFHEDVRPFKCEYCNYQSRTNSQLKVHMMRHAGIKQYLCQICNYNGVTQSDLNRHCKTRSHALRSANICPQCSLGFATRTLLDDHIIKLHETSESSNSSDKSNKASNLVQKSTTSERNNNDFSFSSKSFSVKEILN